MKTCSKCETLLPLESFDKKGWEAGKQRYRSECKDCKAKLDKKSKSKVPDVVRKERSKRTYEWRQNRIASLIDYVHKYLSENPCVDCGEEDMLYLEFDHVRGTKVNSVSTMVQRCFPIETIKEEIEKCEVRCVKCHRLVTAIRGNWASLNSPYRLNTGRIRTII